MVPISASTASVTLRAKNEFQEKNSSRMPEPNRPITAPPPATPTQTPTARPRSSGGNEVVITDSVVGITAAAPAPMSTRAAISIAGVVDGERPTRRGAEDDQPGDQDALAAVPVAERAGGQQQPGEHDRVRVDDPGQLGLAGPGGPGQVGQRDVQPADRGDDHHQRQRDDGEDGPAAGR